MAEKILSNKKFQKESRITEKSWLYKKSKILNNENAEIFLHNFQKKFVIVPIDKVAKNFPLICKKFCIAKILNEIGLNNTWNPSNEFSRRSKEWNSPLKHFLFW